MSNDERIEFGEFTETAAASSLGDGVELYGRGQDTAAQVRLAQVQDPAPTDKGDRLPQEAADTPVAMPSQVTPDENHVVALPAGASVDEIRVQGDDLVLVQADGTEIVVIGGAAYIPTFLIGDVEVPQQVLLAVLEQDGINVAAGPDGAFSVVGAGPGSSGGDFVDELPQQDAGGPNLLALLGNTELNQEGNNGNEDLADDTPTITDTASLLLIEDAVDGSFENQTADGRFGFDPGNDGGRVTAISFSGAFNVDEEGGGADTGMSLFSGGIPVVVSVNGLVITGTAGDGGPVVFTLTVTNPATGAFTFQQTGPLDHPDQGETGTADIIRLEFKYTVTDLDNDGGTGTASILIGDDGPLTSPAVGGEVEDEAVNGGNDEDDGLAASVTGSLNIDWGADSADDSDPRSLAFDGANVEAVGIYGETLTSLGRDVHTAVVDGVLIGYTGDAEPSTPTDESVVFHVTLSDAGNGSYTFTLVQPLDHAAGDGENSLTLTFGFKATDADGDSSSSTVTVTVVDDIPVAVGVETGTAAENDLASLNLLYPAVFDFWQGSLGTSPYDGTSSDDSHTGLFGTVPVWGNLADNIRGGADSGGVFNLVSEADAETILQTLGPNEGYLTSKGQAVNDARMITIPGIGDAMGFFAADGRLIFGLFVTQDGTYNFRLFDQLDHPEGDDPETDAPEAVADTISIDLSHFVTFTDYDGDTIDLRDVHFVVEVTDDIPVVVGNLEITLNEGDLGNFLSPVNALLLALRAPVVGSNGNEQDPEGLLDNVFGTTSASGFLNNLFGDKIVAGGADEIGRFGLVTEAEAEALLAAAGWSSNKSAITDVRMVTIDGIGQAMAFFAEDGRMIISLTLGNGPLGAYDIRIWDQLDHEDNSGTPSPEAFEDILALNLGQFITYTDGDGDKIALDGHVTLNVVDDIPKVVGTKTITLDEDDLSSFNPLWIPQLAQLLLVQGSDGSDQNPDGLFDGLLGTTSQSGLLNDLLGNRLVSGGADEFGKFGMVSESYAETLLGGWSSKGHPINDVRALQLPPIGSVLGFFTDDGRLVFTLAVSEIGAYDVRLFDQLDHAYGNNGENTLQIDLSKFVTYTDADGDTIDLGTGTLVLNVIDDAPVATGATVTVTVEEEHSFLQSGEMSHGNEDYDDANGLDADTPDIFGIPIPNVLATTNVASGNLKTLVTTGADEGGAFTLSEAVSGPVMTAGENPEIVTSKRGTVLLDYASGQIVGFVDVNNNGTYETGDRPVFTLTVNANGGFTFTLLDQLDHTYGDNLEDIITLNLGPAVTYTDADGDSITLTSGLNIQVIDDMPIADIKLNNNKYLTLDETVGGTPSAAGDPNANDEAAATASPLAAPVIGYAADSGVGSLFADNSSVGADEGMTSSYALKIVSSASGLFDAKTDAAITLEAGTGDLAGMVVGKYGPGDTDISFVIKIDPATGATSVWQYRAVEHNNNGTDPDDTVAIASGSLEIEITVSDYDGDTSKDTIDLGSRIQFQDDAPMITNIETGGIAMNWPDVVSTTGSIDVHYGSDGAAATGSLVISSWPTVAGVTTVLSDDKLTLTGSYDGQPLYTLTLDPLSGEYQFTLHQEWPATPSQTISVTSTQFAAGPQNDGTHTYGDVTFSGINPFANGQFLGSGTSGGGAGVGNSTGIAADSNNNRVTNGESFAANFARPMEDANISLYVVASLLSSSPDVRVTWIAYRNGVQVGTGEAEYNNTTGQKTIAIDPAGGAFDQVVFSVSSNTFSYVQLTGLTGTTAAIPADDQNLQFQVTATDGDGDTFTSPLTIHLEAVPEVTVTNASVDEAGLPARAGGSAGTDEAADGNSYDNDVNSEVATGTITIASTDGLKEVRFTKEGDEDRVVSLAELNDSGSTPVVVFDDATGKLEIIGYNAGVITYRYTLENNVDHRVEGADVLEFTVVAVDPDGYASVPVKLTVTIEDDAPVTGGAAQTGSLSETVLPGVDSDFGSLNVLAGADSRNMHVEIKTDDDGNPIINSGLTSDGVALVYEVRTTNGVDQELVAYKEGGNPEDDRVFIVTVLRPGSFATTLYQNLDHLGGSGETLTLNLVARVFDGEGDYVDQPFSIDIADSAPTASDVAGPADITENQDWQVTLVEGTDFDFGADDTGTSLTLGTPTYTGVPSGVTIGTPTVQLGAGGRTVSVIPGEAFDGLAAGQTVTMRIPYTVTDGDNDSVTKEIIVTITGTNDGPTLSASVTEITYTDTASDNTFPEVTGMLTGGDVDVADTLTYGIDDGANSDAVSGYDIAKAGAYGILYINSLTGAYRFVPNDAAIEGLKTDTTESFTLTVSDGTASAAQTLDIKIKGANDTAEIGGTAEGAVTEDGTQTAGGTLLVTDRDTGDTGFQLPASLAGVYGDFTFNASTGEWTYTLRNSDANVEELNGGDVRYDKLTVYSADGSASQEIVVTVNGADDATPAPTVNENTSADGRYAFTRDSSAPNVLGFTTSSLFNGNPGTSYSFTMVYATDSDWAHWITFGANGSSVSGNPDEVDYGLVWPLPPIWVVTDSDGDSGLYVFKVSTAGGEESTYVAFSAIEGAGRTHDIQNNGGYGNSNSLNYANLYNSNGDLILINHNINGTLWAGAGHDVVVGSANEETVDGGSGDDAIYGMGGDDTLSGGSGNDFIDGGDGDDTIYGDGGDDVLLGGAGNDTIYGGGGNDILVGGSGADTLRGEAGDDLLIGDQSDLLLDGGSGYDTLELSGDFTSTSNNQIQGIERVVLTQAATLDLSNQSEGFKIVGSGGDDIIRGGAGADIIVGGAGADILRGNGGADQFRLTTTGGTDTILDYIDGTDKIAFLDRGNFTNGSVNFSYTTGSAAGANLNSNDFTTRDSITAIQSSVDNSVVRIDEALSEQQIMTQVSGTSGSGGSNHATNNYILVFNSTSGKGEIWFDNDWSDADMSNRVKVAVLDNVTTLTALKNITASDIRVYSDVSDPIILDLDGNGFAFSSIDQGVLFDINADGSADRIGWTSRDGILAFDLDGNGLIDNGSEIFTPDFNGGTFESGLAALASLDSNGDGRIDADDEAFSKLSIWVDANNNGITDEGELSSLSAHKVASISLGATATGGEQDGQTIFSEGTFTFEDGTTGSYVEVGFDTILGEALGEPTQVTGTDGDDIIASALGATIMTGGAGADTFVLDTDALSDLTLGDIITDYNSDEGDQLDVSSLLTSLLGHEASEAEALASVRTSVAGSDTIVSVGSDAAGWHDVAVLHDYTSTVKVLYDDDHNAMDPTSHTG